MNNLLAQKLYLPWTGGGTTIQGPMSGNPFTGDTSYIFLGDILSKAMSYVFIFAGIGLLLMLIMSGFSYLTSAGDPKKLEQGKARLTNAILGFVIIFAAYWVVQIAGIIFGIDAIGSIFK
jgi:hypothetical protein